MLPSIVRLIRIVSIGVCLVVIGSFVAFAVTQTKSASGRQEALIGPGSAPARTSGRGSKEGGLHRTIDEVSSRLTSPFAGVVSSSSEWVARIVKLLLALLVYGFGLGYLARTLTVRI